MEQITKAKKTSRATDTDNRVATSALKLPAKKKAPKKKEAVRGRMSKEEFAALAPEEKRRAVARDVLEQLAAATYRAKHLAYVVTSKKLQKALSEKRSLGQEAWNANGAGACYVCGVGSVFVSTMLMSDPETGLEMMMRAEDHTGDLNLANSTGRNLLRQVFDQKQLALIESAFEKSTTIGCSGWALDEQERRKAARFNVGVKGGALGELSRIMENIVEHGEFRP